MVQSLDEVGIGWNNGPHNISVILDVCTDLHKLALNEQRKFKLFIKLLTHKVKHTRYRTVIKAHSYKTHTTHF